MTTCVVSAWRVGSTVNACDGVRSRQNKCIARAELRGARQWGDGSGPRCNGTRNKSQMFGIWFFEKTWFCFRLPAIIYFKWYLV